MRLQGKSVIVTGSSRGIGFAIAELFVREGARVAICGSRLESAEKGVNKMKEIHPESDILAVGVDMTNEESIVEMVSAVKAHFGEINVLVNNAGVTATKSIFDMTTDDFTSVMEINLTAPFIATREVAKIMRDQGKGGSIINTSSMVGTYGGRMQTAYSSSKFGINGLTKSCAKELGPYNIRVNAVAPGVVGTDMMANFVDDKTKVFLEKAAPLGRMADPSELAGAYLYLASDEASFTTGTIIQVDGGIVM